MRLTSSSRDPIAGGSDVRRVAQRLREELEGRRNPTETPAPPSTAPDRTERVWWMVLETGGRPFQIKLKKGVTVIGRDDSCDVRIPANTVSKFHCRIEVHGDRLHVEDMRSRNGTYHNKRRILESEVSTGDYLAVGPISFRVFCIRTPARPHGALVRPHPTGDETMPALPSVS